MCMNIYVQTNIPKNKHTEISDPEDRPKCASHLWYLAPVGGACRLHRRGVKEGDEALGVIT